MFNAKTLTRGADNKFLYADENGEAFELTERFPAELWDDPRAFKMAGVRGYEPMTAKELETEEAQDKEMTSPFNILEEKFDGTRALVYFMSSEDYNTHEQIGFCRVFSRRISKKTGFYVENTDSLPQIRELNVPDLAGTILDGEMFIDGLPFKEVSSTLNCLWDKAVDRQIEKGFITLHAFDILFYKGTDLRRMPLERRKVYLHLAVEEAACPYITEVKYYDCGKTLYGVNTIDAITERVGEENYDMFIDGLKDNKDTYPHLYSDWRFQADEITPRGYYELIVSTGGEGLIVKPKNGRYHHKRGWEYSKVKKFLTREMIVMGFSEPTREYTGKDVKKWGFWVDKQNKRVTGNFYGDSNYTPVTKFYFYNQVGNLLLGVLIHKDTYHSMPKNKQGDAYPPSAFDLDPELDGDYLLMQVCECAGFDDDTRETFTKNRESMVGSVVEVKANELFRDTGKMRHPRFMRVRLDKEPERCVWEDHIGVSEVTK